MNVRGTAAQTVRPSRRGSTAHGSRLTHHESRFRSNDPRITHRWPPAPACVFRALCVQMGGGNYCVKSLISGRIAGFAPVSRKEIDFCTNPGEIHRNTRLMHLLPQIERT